jgi:homoserine kinase
MRLTATVPATSANLGPGFDCFGLALDLCNEVTIDTDAEPGVSWEGEGADELPTDGTDLVHRGVEAALERQRRIHPNAEIPPFALHGVNRIPLERGLGSSSAALVAGVALANRLLGDAGWDEREPSTTAAYAGELEGHLDNAAPAAFGGLTVIAEGHVERFEVAPAIRPVVLVPDGERLSTAEARRALPETVPLRDAVFNVGHGALVVQALIGGDLDLLRMGLHDRFHESARLALFPAVAAVYEELARAVPVCVSGSGPSLLAFERDDHPVPDPGAGWWLIHVGVRAAGVEVVAS